MRILGSWLQEFHSIASDLDGLRETLTGAGIEVAELVPLDSDDFTLEIELTANRPDLLCHFGLARELAAIEGGDLVAPDLGEDPGFRDPGEAGACSIAVESVRCGRYAGLVLDGVAVGPSPDWLVERIERMGLRPISNVVDITNYVLFELNHPLHAFDLDTLQGGIVVRQARPGEEMELLDGSRKVLVEDDLVIADAMGPVALAGVMGGARTAVSSGTTRILLEAAWFQPSSVRRTARRHGLSTDSSYRFERGADPEGLVTALRRAAVLIRQCAGGRPDGGILDIRGLVPDRRTIVFRPSQVERVLGCAVPGATEMLERLGCAVSGTGEERAVAVPSWRVDLEREIDLVEEIARLAGYDRIPSRLPALRGRSRDFDAVLSAGAMPAGLDPFSAAEDYRWMRRELAENLRLQGYDACMHFSFAPPGFGELPLANPIHAEHSTMRATLIPALVGSARLRLHRAGRRRSLLFELDKAFRRGPDGNPAESWTLAAIVSGTVEDRRYDGREADAATPDHVIGTVHALGAGLGIAFTIRPGETYNAWHAKTFVDPAVLESAGVAVGTVGEVALGGVRDADLGAVYGFELDLEALWRAVAPARRVATYRPLPRYPAATRDLAFLVDERLAVGEVLGAARAAAPAFLESLEVFDVFVFPGKGLKSVGLRLVLRSPDRTLTESEIGSAVDVVIARVTSDCRATLRSQ